MISRLTLDILYDTQKSYYDLNKDLSIEMLHLNQFPTNFYTKSVKIFETKHWNYIPKFNFPYDANDYSNLFGYIGLKIKDHGVEYVLNRLNIISNILVLKCENKNDKYKFNIYKNISKYLYELYYLYNLGFYFSDNIDSLKKIIDNDSYYDTILNIPSIKIEKKDFEMIDNKSNLFSFIDYYTKLLVSDKLSDINTYPNNDLYCAHRCLKSLIDLHKSTKIKHFGTVSESYVNTKDFISLFKCLMYFKPKGIHLPGTFDNNCKIKIIYSGFNGYPMFDEFLFETIKCNKLKIFISNKYLNSLNHFLQKLDNERKKNIQIMINAYKEDLIAKCWHPNRIVDWCLSIDDKIDFEQDV